MDRRTKILAGVFGAFIAYALVSSVVYPAWIEPLLKIDETIAEREAKLGELEALESALQDARWEYREYAKRVGSFDARKVEHDLRERLNKLIEKHGLEETNVGVRHTKSDRKTKLETMSITVSASGSLQSVVLFLKDLSELPNLISVTNPTIAPSSSSKRRAEKTDRVELNVPLEVWVLPELRIVGRVPAEELVQPESLVRHEDRRYSQIWEMEPFWAPIPLEARVKKNVNVEKDEPAFLEVVASGGDGEYRYAWKGDEELASPDSAKTGVVTSKIGTFEYEVTVSDGSEHVATATAKVTVREKPKPVVKRDEDESPPVPQGPQRWKDGKQMHLTMALIRHDGSKRFSEVQVRNDKTKRTEYYTVNDEFDGGEVVFVHQTGVLVRRQDEYFVYPIGAALTDDLAVDEAVDYPRLQAAARYLREFSASEEEPVAGEEEGAAGGGEASADSGEGAELPVAGGEANPEGTKRVSAPGDGAAASPGGRRSGSDAASAKGSREPKRERTPRSRAQRGRSRSTGERGKRD